MTPHAIDHTRAKSQRRHQSGSSLIEVLVSALILAFGMLALVSMQASATQMGKIAQFKADASRLALSYSERVRTNRTALANYMIGDGYDGAPAPFAKPAQLCNGAVACTNIQIAALDVAEMREAARVGLPGGALQVSNEIVNGRTVLNVWLIWQISSTNSDANADRLAGQGCPANVANPTAGTTQCLLSRFVL